MGAAAHDDPYLGLAQTQDLAAHLGSASVSVRTRRAPQVRCCSGSSKKLGLTGNGGGHFPVARKWRTVLRHGGGGIVVANGAESEPASAKDRALLTTVPHLVLDGLACAAEVLGARRGGHLDARGLESRPPWRSRPPLRSGEPMGLPRSPYARC